jgi:hypothetical protein
MDKIRKIPRLLGVMALAVFLNTFIAVVAYITAAWLSDYVSSWTYVILFSLWLLGICLFSWRVIVTFQSQLKDIFFKISAWFIGIGVSFGLIMYLYSNATYEGTPSNDASIVQILSHTRSQMELYYGNRLGGGFSYEGGCSSDKIVPLLRAVEQYGVTVSCFDSDEGWAIESTLTKQEGYYCVDYTGAEGRYFDESEINADDMVCGDNSVVGSVRTVRDIDVSQMHEVYGDEKVRAVQMAGAQMAAIKGRADLNQDLIQFTYTTSTNTYNFESIGFYISSNVAVGLVDMDYKEVYFHNDGRVFVK